MLSRLGEFSLKLLLRSATNLICARHRDSGRHGPYQSRECSGEIVSMTLSRNAIVRWTVVVRNRSSGVGVDTQDLEYNGKIPKSIARVGAQPPLEQRRCQSKGFDCTRTH